MKLVLSVSVFVLLMLTVELCVGQAYAYKKGEIAVGEYDIISYFGDGLLKGNKSIRTTYKEMIFLFENQENLNEFQNDPEKYMPAYGGWCGMALAQGELVIPNPQVFAIIEGKIYLFEVKVFLNGKVEWFKNPKKNKELADLNYKKLLLQL